MRKTNKYIKYIKRFSIMIVTLLLSFTIVTQDAHAIVVGSNDYSIRDYFLLANDTDVTTQTFTGSDNIIGGKLHYLDSLTDVHLVQFELNSDINYLTAFRYLYFNAYENFNDPFDSDYNVLYVNISGDEFLSNYDTISDVRYWGSEYTVSGFDPNAVLYDDETYLGSLFTVGTHTSKIYVSFVVQSDDTVNFVQAYLLNYLTKQIYITNRTAYNILNSSFLNTNDLEDAYNQGYDDASDNFINNVIPAEKTASYNQARSFFGIFDNEQWYPASTWGSIRYDEGFDDGELVGINTSQGEAYDQGYIDGSEDSFMASIKDWIVPAIIVVLFLGGALTIIAKKREG